MCESARKLKKRSHTFQFFHYELKNNEETQQILQDAVNQGNRKGNIKKADVIRFMHILDMAALHGTSKTVSIKQWIQLFGNIQILI